MRARGPSPEQQAAIPPPSAWWEEHTRPAAPRRPPPPRPAPRPLPGVVPTPGRHAARRSRRPASPLPDRLSLGPAQLAVVAVVVAVGLAVTCWWLVRGGADPASELAAAPAVGVASASTVVQPLATPTATAASPAVSTPGTVTVDVAGKVRRPGIAVLDAGSRVVDALEAAGGARPGVDLTGLNLARLLVDGEQVVVGAPVPSGAAAAAVPTGGTPSGGPPTLVNLNTATEAELDTLPEVGPVTAASILTWRDEHGGFTSVDELLEVDGIGEVTLDRVAPFVTV